MNTNGGGDLDDVVAYRTKRRTKEPPFTRLTRIVWLDHPLGIPEKSKGKT